MSDSLRERVATYLVRDFRDRPNTLEYDPFAWAYEQADRLISLFEEERRGLEALLRTCQTGRDIQLARAEKAEACVKQLEEEQKKYREDCDATHLADYETQVALETERDDARTCVKVLQELLHGSGSGLMPGTKADAEWRAKRDAALGKEDLG